MARAALRPFLLATLAGVVLAGCQDGQGPFARKDGDGPAAVSRAETSTRLIERDVEAPQVFQTTDQALWDGRPSLGGVWVASPETTDPERVIIRNPGNGKFVIGALFRRERLNPGPTLQISSDAAAALGILAGQPTSLSVTALRREEVADAPAVAAEGAKPILDAAEAVETTTLASAAGAAIARAEAAPAAAPAATPAKPLAPTMPAAAVIAAAAPGAPTAAPAPASTAKPKATPASAATGRALVQIGIFSVEANAKRAASALEKASVPTRILREQSQGKTFWRVVAGPATTTREDMLAKVKAAGFADAYFVSR